MKKQYSLALHIFRRDLRLQDNTALIAALKSAEQVIPCFIFDERQIEKNDYKSDHGIQFMVHSLTELDIELKKHNSHLYCFYGIAENMVEQLIQSLNIQAVFINRDYTPFSRARDNHIQMICQNHNIDFHCYADALLHEPEHILKPNKTPYTIFTHFFHAASQQSISSPQKNSYDNYYSKKISFEDEKKLSILSSKNNPNLRTKGGRKEALFLLKKATQLVDYKNIRDFPASEGTTLLSAHNKFGTISIREFYSAIKSHLGNQHTLITELYWRDFFTHIAFHYPHVFHSAFHKKYAHLPWTNNEKYFRMWCEGRTGFPIIDAGMRELNTTGYMHNRVRMITASFLTKDLHIDWHLGEKYFANQLIDYDPAVNNGNWQWAASTGCDAQPYFRIFNPWLQQQKFDPDCIYIKRFIPELVHLSPAIIHAWHQQPFNHATDYPQPIVNHVHESKLAKLMYKKQTID